MVLATSEININYTSYFLLEKVSRSLNVLLLSLAHYVLSQVSYLLNIVSSVLSLPVFSFNRQATEKFWKKENKNVWYISTLYCISTFFPTNVKLYKTIAQALNPTMEVNLMTTVNLWYYLTE